MKAINLKRIILLGLALTTFFVTRTDFFSDNINAVTGADEPTHVMISGTRFPQSTTELEHVTQALLGENAPTATDLEKIQPAAGEVSEPRHHKKK